LDASGPEGSGARRSALEELHRRLAGLDPVGAARVEPSNRRRLVRALEVTLGSGRPFSSFGPGLERYPPTPVTMVGIRTDPTTLDGRIAERFDRLMALGYRELLAHVEEGVSLDTAVALAVQRTRALSRRQMAWFRRDPRIVWLDPEDDPVGSLVALLGGFPRDAATVGDWHTTQ